MISDAGGDGMLKYKLDTAPAFHRVAERLGENR
jgi:hypothetical protein